MHGPQAFGERECNRVQCRLAVHPASQEIARHAALCRHLPTHTPTMHALCCAGACGRASPQATPFGQMMTARARAHHAPAPRRWVGSAGGAAGCGVAQQLSSAFRGEPFALHGALCPLALFFN